MKKRTKRKKKSKNRAAPEKQNSKIDICSEIKFSEKSKTSITPLTRLKNKRQVSKTRL